MTNITILYSFCQKKKKTLLNAIFSSSKNEYDPVHIKKLEILNIDINGC